MNWLVSKLQFLFFWFHQKMSLDWFILVGPTGQTVKMESTLWDSSGRKYYFTVTLHQVMFLKCTLMNTLSLTWFKYLSMHVDVHLFMYYISCLLVVFETEVMLLEASDPSGCSLSQFPWHEVTRGILTPLWMRCVVHHRVTLPPSSKFTNKHLIYVRWGKALWE